MGNFFSEVVASGLWVAPGDSEEVAAALSQALRNCIERFFSPPILPSDVSFGHILPFYLIKFGRALLGLYYMRFGDVFSKVHQFQREELLRYVFTNIFRLSISLMLIGLCKHIQTHVLVKYNLKKINQLFLLYKITMNANYNKIWLQSTVYNILTCDRPTHDVCQLEM